MNEEQFIQQHSDTWHKLLYYNRRLNKKGVHRFNDGELTEFTDVFRSSMHHLAYARTHYSGGRAADLLNSAVGSAHNNFYSRNKIRLSDVAAYFINGFPTLVQSEIKLFWLSLLTFIFGGTGAYLLLLIDPSLLGFFIPVEFGPGGGIDSWMYPLLSSFIITNNIRVAALAFALGFLAGAGTLYILCVNGALIGAYVYAAQTSGYDMLNFWALILPHGVIELAAIFISGAAGLMIGRAMLMPGKLNRRDAVVNAAKRAVRMMPGIAVMLLIAGLIEGFVTPLDIADVWKYIVAGVTFVAVQFYLRFIKLRV